MTISFALGAYAIAISPDLPLWLIGLGGVLLAVAFALSLWRNARGAWLRGAAGLALIVALLQPSLIEEKRSYRDDIAVILVDRSPSQGLESRRTESDAILADLKAKLAKIDGLDVRIVESGPGKESAEKGTTLFATLRDAVADLPPGRLAGIAAITDGQIHDAPKALADLGIAAPFHVLLTGDPDKGDRRILVEEAPSFGLVGQKIEAKIRIEDLGAPVGGTAMVEIRRDGIAEPPVALRLGQASTIPLAIAHGGETVFEFGLVPGPQEITTVNNKAVIAVHGVRDRLRVLLVSGEPYPGERVWRNLLKSDPAVDLIHFTILRPPNKQDATPINELALIAFPIDELFDVKLRDFDLIIFDRFQHLDILPEEYFRHIVDYVREGGAVLESAGPSSAGQFSLYRTALTDIFAAIPTGEVIAGAFRPGLSDLGRKHPVTAGLAEVAKGEEAQWGRWFRQVAMRSDRGQVLMTGADGLPLLILDRVGKGRVAQIASDQIWLWSKGFEGGGPQAELIRRIAHWLMQEPDLEEEALRAIAIDDAIEIERRSLGEAAGSVEVTMPDGKIASVKLQEIAPGRATGRILASETGLYRVDDGERLAFAASGAVNSLEFSDPRATARILRPLAEVSGGAVIERAATNPPALRRVDPEAIRSGRDWLGLVKNGDYQVSGLAQFPLLPGWAGLLLAIGLLFLAWRREGR